MPKYLIALLISATAFAQSPSLPNFSTAIPQSGVKFETREAPLPAASVRICSSSTVAVTRSSGTVLSIANGAGSTAPQFVRFGFKTRALTAAATLTISSGSATGSVDIYGQLSAGSLALIAFNRSTNTLSFPGGTVVTAPPPTVNLILLYSWAISSGNWAVSGGTDQQTNVDCWIDELDITNTTSGAVTVSVADGQGLSLFGTASIPANTTQGMVAPGGQFFDGGASITAGTASALTLHARGLRAIHSNTNP